MFNILFFIFVLFFITLIHELGHLIVAKLNGVGVEIFSIGFGQRIIGFKFYKGKISYAIANRKPSNQKVWNKGKTEYRISGIFFGGYCKMNGEMIGKGKSDDLVSKNYRQKLYIALAGVGANIILGVSIISAITIKNLGLKLGIQRAFEMITGLIRHIITALYLLITRQVKIATFGEIIEQFAGGGLEYNLLILAVFSIAIGVFNLIPFPALDGSLPFLWGLEKIFGKKKGEMIANIICRIGFLILMFLQILIIIYWIFT